MPSVHAYGRLEVVQDQAWLLAHVSELSRAAGGTLRRSRGRLRTRPANFIAALARGIVGLKLSITRLEAKAKMSQNREQRDRAGVVHGLGERADGQDAATAALVDKLMR